MNQVKDGPGITTYKDGSEIYKGLYFNGLRHGPGEVNYSNGSYFKGFYEKGMWEGHGLYIRGDGIEFKGTWKENLLVDEI